MYTYVISNSLGKLYVGITKDIDKRLKQHRAGKCKETSKTCKNWNYIHIWEMPNYLLASHLERWMHRLPESQILDIILDFPVFCKALHRELLKISPTDFEINKCKHLGKTRNEIILRARLLKGVATNEFL